MSDMSEKSITTKEEAQEYVESFSRELLPAALDKLRSALYAASKPKEISELVEQIRSYAQVRKTSDNAAVAAGAAMGAAISGQAIAGVFQGLASAFGIEAEVTIPERDVTEDLKEMEKLYEMEKEDRLEENDTIEEIEEVEKIEILEKTEKGDEGEETELNDFQFGD